jgi:hypothetical protein
MFEYDKSNVAISSKVKNVRSVTFAKGRYGVCEHTIRFPRPVTEIEAVLQAEMWLSQPMTAELLEELRSKGDLMDETMPLKDYKNRAEAFAIDGEGAIFLESLDRSADGTNIFLFTGSCPLVPDE